MEKVISAVVDNTKFSHFLSLFDKFQIEKSVASLESGDGKSE